MDGQEPPARPTVDLPKPSEGGVVVERILLEMRAGFARLEANHGLLTSQIDIVKGRLETVEGRQSELDQWRRSASERARSLSHQTSDADLAHEAKMAAEIEARQALEKKVDALDLKQDTQLAILTDIKGLAKNPYVKQVLTALATAFLTWLASKGLK